MTSAQSNFKKRISFSLFSIRARDFLVPLSPVSHQELIKPQISSAFIPGGTQHENRSFSSWVTWEWSTGGWKGWEKIGLLPADAQMVSDTPTSHITSDTSQYLEKAAGYSTTHLQSEAPRGRGRKTRSSALAAENWKPSWITCHLSQNEKEEEKERGKGGGGKLGKSLYKQSSSVCDFFIFKMFSN